MRDATPAQIAALRAGGSAFWTFSLTAVGATVPFVSVTTYSRSITIDGITYTTGPPFVLGATVPELTSGSLTRDKSDVVLSDNNLTIRNHLNQNGYLGLPMEWVLWFYNDTTPRFVIGGWAGDTVEYLPNVEGLDGEYERVIGLSGGGPISSYDRDPTHYATEDQLSKIPGFITSDALRHIGSTQDIPVGRSSSN